MFKTILQFILLPIRLWFWTYVSLGFEQDLHNNCGGYTYKKPNIIYIMYRLIDKDFRKECNYCIENATPRNWTKRSRSKWNHRKNK